MIIMCSFEYRSLLIRIAVEGLKTKWKNIKAKVRRRNEFIKQAQQYTGGGPFKDQRVIDSPLFMDIATRMGISLSGLAARFDSDSGTGTSTPNPPTNRLARVMNETVNEDFMDSVQSIDSVESMNSVQSGGESSHTSAWSGLRSHRDRLTNISLQSSAGFNETDEAIRNMPSCSNSNVQTTRTMANPIGVNPRLVPMKMSSESAPPTRTSNLNVVDSQTTETVVTTTRRGANQRNQRQNVRDVQLPFD